MPSGGSSTELAGAVAWYYEAEGLTPMLIGHSQGGMLAIKVLHELAGSFSDEVDVWNPLTDTSEHRTWIRDPRSGNIRPVVGLKLPYVAALATGKLPRLLLGQWSMLKKVREVPDSVEEFSGYTIAWDPIAGTFPGSEAYKATGLAKVRNITLDSSTSHIGMPRARALAQDKATRAWIDAYRVDEQAPLPEHTAADTSNLRHAADIWFSVKKHWCIGAAAIDTRPTKQSGCGSMKDRLNFFQRMMLRWRDLHPYNAVHVIIVRERLDSTRLSDAISRQLRTLGLTHLELDRARGRYEWGGGSEEAGLRLVRDDDPQCPGCMRKSRGSSMRPSRETGPSARFVSLPLTRARRFTSGSDTTTLSRVETRSPASFSRSWNAIAAMSPRSQRSVPVPRRRTRDFSCARRGPRCAD